ncbi:MAG: tandem-95 repeat protein [Gammaproteobacteria bacterium]|nr:tandem-95 repeat protein [Gammaproteobacteria bacterium]
MSTFSGQWFRRSLSILVYALVLVGLSACSGGGSSDDDDAPASVTVSGGGVKGPLANADATVYAFDPAQPGFKGAIVATATTDASAAIVGLTLAGSATPPFILEFTSNGATTDITTGAAPVIGTLRTVITQAMLDSGEPIYGTPLTTMGVDIAIANSGPATTAAQFEAALAAAAEQVTSTVGFGMPGDIDIYRTPPLVNDDTDTAEEQADVAAYRSAVEALTAVVFAIDQQASGDTSAALMELSMDLADGSIDGVVGGNPSAVFSSTALDVLAQDPATLTIPNTTLTVADVQAILVSETATTGTATSTSELDVGGSIDTETSPAATDPDRDGDGTPNAQDAFPDDPNEDVDSDGDGIGDNADPDDDNNGVLDVDEGGAVNPGPDDDDGDGVLNGADNCPAIYNTSQTNTDGLGDGGDACDADDDEDGTPDVDDAFPLDATEQSDADGDGTGDVADTDDDNDGRSDASEDVAGASVDHDNDGIPNREDTDSDNDGVLDSIDLDPYDDAVSLNQAPVVADGSVTTDEDVTVAVTLGATDDGAVPGALVYSLSGPANGVVGGSAPNLTYTPNPEFNGSDSLSFTVTDGGGATSISATVTITVNPVNDDPVIDQADPLAVTMDEDGSPTGFVAPSISASDNDGDTLSWSGSAAANGIASVSGSGASPTISYAPNADFSGGDSFVVTVSDGNGGSDTITVNVTVDPVNDDPVIAEGDSVGVTMSEDGAPIAFVAPTITATDIDGGTLSWTGSAASNGTASVSGSGASPTISYAPNANFVGSDSFTATVDDGNGGSDTITIEVTVGGSNDDPVIDQAGPLAVTMDEDGAPIAFVAPTISATDIDGDSLTWSGSAATNGTASVSGTGASPTISYTPNADFSGGDSFDVTVSDGNGGSDTITVNVTVDPVNDDPVIAEGDSVGVTMSEDGAPIAFVAPTISATDIDGGALSWTGSAASNGAASVSGNGASPTITYTPDAGFSGVDSFTATVSDGNGGSDSITINVTVGPVNDDPVIDQAGPLSVTMDEDGSPIAFVAPTITATDVDSATLTWSGSTAGNGTASVSGTGASPTISYSPNADFNGSDSFDVTVGDGEGGSATITVNVTVNPRNDAPLIDQAGPLSVTMNENGDPIAFVTPTITATDVDGDTLTWSGSTAGNGVATVSGTGASPTITYVPNIDYTGDDSFDVTVSDGNGGSASITIEVSITAPPTGGAVWDQFNWDDGSTWQ